MDTNIQSREEAYLAKIAGENVEVPENPESRSEYWLKKIAENGAGGGGGGSMTVDSEMSSTSTNPVQNKVIKEYVDTSVLPETERAKIHEHANKNILDGIEVALTSQYMSQIMAAVYKAHEHGNKSVLDAIQVPLTGELNTKWNDAADDATSLKTRVSALEFLAMSATISGDDLTIENAIEAPLMEMSIYGSIKIDSDILDDSGEVIGQKVATMDNPVDFTGRTDPNGANPITITKNVGNNPSDISRGVLLYSTLYGIPIPKDASSTWQDKASYTYNGINYFADEAVVTSNDAYLIKRIQYREFTSKSGWKLDPRSASGPGMFKYGSVMDGWNATDVCVSTLPVISYSEYTNETQYGLAYRGGTLYLRVEGITTLDELDTWIKARTFKVAYPLSNPITISQESSTQFDYRDVGYIRNLMNFGLSGNYSTNTIKSYTKGYGNVFGVKYAVPPVSKWAAQPTKPTYTAEEVNAVTALRPKSTYGYIRKDLISIVNGAWATSKYTFTHDGYVTFDPNDYYDGEMYNGNQYTARRDEIRIDGVSIGIIGYSRISVSADDSLYVMNSLCTIPKTIYVHEGQTISAVQSFAATAETMAGSPLTMHIWDTEPGGSQGRTS